MIEYREMFPLSCLHLSHHLPLSDGQAVMLGQKDFQVQTNGGGHLTGAQERNMVISMKHKVITSKDVGALCPVTLRKNGKVGGVCFLIQNVWRKKLISKSEKGLGVV